jgi:N-acetylneuraminic acid mutarotase
MNKKMLAGLVMSSLLWIGQVEAASGPVWTTLASVPKNGVGVEGMSVAVVGDQIIAALGHDFGDTDTTRIYDIASNTWSTGAPAPGASSEGAGVSHGGLLYALGGRGFGARADLWSYSPATNTWTTLASMPTARAGLAAAQEGNVIYAIGGRQNTGGPCSGSPVAAVEAYDIDTDTWTTVAPLPAPRSDLAAATIGGKIYVFGGCDAAGNFLNTVDVYDPITNVWSPAPADMPTARAAMYAVAAKGGTVYVIGGWDGVNPGLSTNEAYKISSNTWTSGLLPMPTARAEASAVGHGGQIYIVGGATPGFGASVDANEAFKP